MSTIHLVPSQCAEQFDLYASMFAKDKADWAFRVDKHLGNPDSHWTLLAYAQTQHAAAEASAHQLSFCAQFLRDNAVLRWTRQTPTKPGTYWFRADATRQTPRRLVHVLELEDVTPLSASHAEDPHCFESMESWEADYPDARWSSAPVSEPEGEVS